MLGLESSRKQSSNNKQYLNLDEGSFLTQFSKGVALPVGDLRELDSHLASVYTYLASRDWRKKIEVRWFTKSSSLLKNLGVKTDEGSPSWRVREFRAVYFKTEIFRASA